MIKMSDEDLLKLRTTLVLELLRERNDHPEDIVEWATILERHILQGPVPQCSDKEHLLAIDLGNKEAYFVPSQTVDEWTRKKQETDEK